MSYKAHKRIEKLSHRARRRMQRIERGLRANGRGGGGRGVPHAQGEHYWSIPPQGIARLRHP